MTNREFYTAVIASVDNDELKEGFRHRRNRKTRCTQRKESVHTFQDTEGERTTYREDCFASHF